ncbi:MAG TPA: DNA polymerase I, partial [Pyrinomonadaceae bacterium]
DYIAAVFDTMAPTFRHESFAAYKANREDMPEDLSAQIPYIVRVCEAFCIPILKMDGFEADDVIGTLAQKVAAKGMQAVIVSNDKDLCQLVKDPNVVAMRQNSQNIKRKVPVPPIEWCDETWVKNKFGVEPKQVIDLLGLMGDAIDNIPGAPGIGEKGAVKLIQEYGSVENAIANADKVTHKTYRESLQNNQDIIRQSVELATVHCEVPVELDLAALKHCDPDRKLAFQLFRELEFNTLTREFADSAPLFEDTGGATRGERQYSVITTRDELDRLVRKLWETEHWAFEVDDSNKGQRSSCYHAVTPRGLAIASATGVSHYVDLENFEGGRDAALEPLRDILTNGFLEKVSFDYKKNLGVLLTLGIEPESVTDDPMIAAYLIDSGRSSYELQNLANTNLDTDTFREVPEGFAGNAYRTAERADFAFQLAPMFRRRIAEDRLERIYSEIELPLEPILSEIERNGMKIDAEKLTQFSETISKDLEELRAKIYAVAGHEFNIGSPKQVGEVLQELNISTGKKTATGQISTSRDILVELAQTYEIAQLIIDYREIDKLKATYADTLPHLLDEDGRIHGCLNQTVAATGRLSSTDPNLQNIPIRTELGQEIRRAFVAEKGNKLIAADYSQLELRILAHVTQDPVMLEAFKNNEDIHTKTARLVFGATTDKELKEARRQAKIVNFAIAYAVEAFGLSSRVGLTKAEARKVIDDYYETYKGVRRYMDDTPEIARERGFVSSLYGRRRYFPSINDRNFSVRTRAEREAINMPIQGTASDIVKIAMINTYRALKDAGLQTMMIMQIHDELLFEAPKAEVERATEIIKREMEAAAELDVPLIAEIGSGDDWMSAK